MSANAGEAGDGDGEAGDGEGDTRTETHLCFVGDKPGGIAYRVVAGVLGARELYVPIGCLYVADQCRAPGLSKG